jgi:hypothetical protein
MPTSWDTPIDFGTFISILLKHGILGEAVNPTQIGPDGKSLPPAPGSNADPAPIVAGKSIFADLLKSMQWPEWCDADGPRSAAAWLEKMGAGKTPGFRRIFGFLNEAGDTYAFPDWFVAAWGGKPGKWGHAVASVLALPFIILDTIVDQFPGGKSCSKGTVVLCTLFAGVLGALSRWAGVDFGPFRAKIGRSIDYACPSVIPSTESILEQHQRSHMAEDDVDGWLRAHGWCDNTIELAKRNGAYEHDARELFWLWRTGKIESQGELERRLSRWHIHGHAKVEEWIDLQYPRLGLGQIAEMRHVLRDGAVDAALVYSEDDAREDVRRLGYRDDQIDQLLYLLDRIPPHRQYVQDYERGRITSEQLVSAMRDEGLRESTIEQLMHLYDHQRKRTLATEAGRPGAASLVRARALGELSADDFLGGLDHLDLSADELQEAVDAAADASAVAKRRAGIAAARSGYLAGEQDRSQSEAALGAFGVDPESAGALLDQWELDAAVRRRPDSPAALCTWAKQGLVTVQDFRRRLMLQGYTQLQVANIVGSCVLKEQERLQILAEKDAAKREKEAITAAEKARRAAAAQAKAIAASEKARVSAIVTAAREDLAELGREAHEVHAAEVAREKAALAVEKAAQGGKSGTVDPLKVAAAEAQSDAAETLPSAAGPESGSA